MIIEETGLRLYSREYCQDLFPAKWREYLQVLPWIVVAGGFEAALSKFYARGIFVAKLLGKNNVDCASKSFFLRGCSLDLGLTLRGAPEGLSVTAGDNHVKLLKEGDARERFKGVCEEMQLPWEDVSRHLTELIEKLYAEALILVELDEPNANAVRSAFEDDESVDLKIRINLKAEE